MSRETTISRDLETAWFEAIPARISSRRFTGEALTSAELDRLEQTCERLSTPSGSARAILIRTAPPEVFTGLVGSYGRIEGAPSCVALVGADDAGHEIGYIGEAIVLDATIGDIESCWIALAFDAERVGPLVGLADGERVHGILALGHATETPSFSERLGRAAMRARKRLPLEKIAPGHEGWPAWAQEAIVAARLAPTGANRQPCRFHMDGDALVMTTAPKPYWTAPLDRGITMLHAELGAAHAGVSGRWTANPAGDLARFVPQSAS
ncbi:MAG: hypothetical protein JW733_08290 [Coriobacteriia bacterium]|nr:hypothetical protein [Coriobacteriia bacterium]MBN2847324.1 hypothetical protein [Coriobacteriia bacterium]